MRIAIDLQAAQGANGLRGIGRYALALSLQIAKQRGEHEIIIVLNGDLNDSVDWISSQFRNVLPRSSIKVWYGVQPTAARDVMNEWRQHASAIIRQKFLESLKPDLVIVTSLFEGLVDGVVTNVGEESVNFPTVVVLYDLIPLIDAETYLADGVTKSWYMSKIEALKRASMWWSISEYSRRCGIELLGLDSTLTVNIGIDADPQFSRRATTTEFLHYLVTEHNIDRPFILYTGGIDPRKNIERLIQAYARLPLKVRSSHQLVIVCGIQPTEKAYLESFALKHGCKRDDIVVTGFVSDDTLVQMYNACRLFIFPSCIEGFGLPVLEAMRCGAIVIGSRGSSISEVIREPAGMFDPYDCASIANAIERALLDSDLRSLLLRNADEQSRRFSWETTARRAIEAAELYHTKKRKSISHPTDKRRLKLAYISPLPPEKSGISIYSSELLPYLSEYYDVDAVSMIRPNGNESYLRGSRWINANSFPSVAQKYDRVLYHFGNSAFHTHMFPLLEKAPGVVVLHDFYLSGIIAHIDRTGIAPGYFAKELVYSHGYQALREHLASSDSDEAIWKYPCNLRVLEDALGVIVHSRLSQGLAEATYGPLAVQSEVIPLLRLPMPAGSKEDARARLGIPTEAFVICSFGIVGPHKKALELLQAWRMSGISKRKSAMLVFVGENDSPGYSSILCSALDNNNASGEVRITGYVNDDNYRDYLSSADMCIQLRTKSRGETSAAILDCLNFGIPTIVNANGSIAELPDDVALKLPDHASVAEIAKAIDELAADPKRRRDIAENGRAMIRHEHNPARCAEMYCRAIEKFYARSHAMWTTPLAEISRLPLRPCKDSLLKASISIAETFPARKLRKQILVDISELVQRDVHTGIQRVVKKILHELLNNPPSNFRIEPVYATETGPYKYARNFCINLLSGKQSHVKEEVIETAEGDIFIALDLQPHVQIAHRSFYEQLRAKHVLTCFLVYDLLPVNLPEHFVAGANTTFCQWLNVVAESDRAICISNSTKNDLRGWLVANRPDKLENLSLESVLLGSDFLASDDTDSAQLPRAVLHAEMPQPLFAMVGTLEPRKGHSQVLDAFELLWNQGFTGSLCIIGKEGWKMKGFVHRLRKHHEKDRRLFWRENANDAELKQLYSKSVALIAASFGEGFGLPLVEAAAVNTPIIARDLPVFREVMGDDAFYFSAMSAEQLAGEIREWMRLYSVNMHPKPGERSLRSWSQTCAELLDKLCKQDT